MRAALSSWFPRVCIAGLLPVFLVACGDSSPGEGTGGSGTTSTSGSTSSGDSTSSSGSGGTTTTIGPDGPWTLETVTLEDLPPVWGAGVAQASPQVAYLAGGVKGTNGPVSGDIYKVEQAPAGVTVTLVSEAATPRFCGCAMVDESRGELIVIGGRGGTFMETETAEIVNLTTGEATALDAGEAAAHPVGCHAVFLPDRDEGYVFGGAAQSSGFDARTWRYSPSDHSFTLVDTAGPPARYDGVLRYPFPGGPVWLVGGMGISAGKAKFYSDIWQLDPEAGTWAEVPATGDTSPPGRRIPWVAFADDASNLIMAMGSDSPQGQTMLDDLWRFDIDMGTWNSIPLNGDPPQARGFAQWLPGPSGSAGLMSGGLTDLAAAKDALIFHPPVTGDWR